MIRASERTTHRVSHGDRPGWFVRVRAPFAAIAVGALAGLTACSGGGGRAPSLPAGIPDTVALGDLPEPLFDPTPPVEPPNLGTTTTTIDPASLYDGPIGGFAAGNTVLVVGDGVLATTADSAGGNICEVLNGTGWTVELAAASGRQIDDGRGAVDERLGPEPTGDDTGDDVHAAVVMLGHVYDGDLDAYTDDLTALVERLAPRPVVLFTLVETDDEAELNDVIRLVAAETPHVRVVDWAEHSAAGSGELLRDGGPLPTRAGSDRLVELVAAELGDAPPTGDTGCVRLRIG